MDGEANLGLNKLAQVMQERMNRNQDANNGALILDFGTIQPDMSLKTNTFAIPIPQSDYHVCRQLTLGPTHNILAKTQDIGKPHSGSRRVRGVRTGMPAVRATSFTGEATGAAPDPPIPSQRTAGGDSSDGMHQHHVLIPEKMRQIKPGDRVLVAWVQSEAVIIDIVLPGTAVKG